MRVVLSDEDVYLLAKRVVARQLTLGHVRFP